MHMLLRRLGKRIAVTVSIILVLGISLWMYFLIDPQSSLHKAFLLAFKQDSRLPALQEHKQQWESSQPRHYQYILEQHAMVVDWYPNPLALPDRVVVEVLDGSIQTIKPLRAYTGTSPEEAILKEGRTLDHLFHFARESIAYSSYPDEVQIDYDESFGYIRKLHVDYRNASDEQRSFEVTSFEALP